MPNKQDFKESFQTGKTLKEDDLHQLIDFINPTQHEHVDSEFDKFNLSNLSFGQTVMIGDQFGRIEQFRNGKGFSYVVEDAGLANGLYQKEDIYNIERYQNYNNTNSSFVNLAREFDGFDNTYTWVFSGDMGPYYISDSFVDPSILPHEISNWNAVGGAPANNPTFNLTNESNHLNWVEISPAYKFLTSNSSSEDFSMTLSKGRWLIDYFILAQVTSKITLQGITNQTTTNIGRVWDYRVSYEVNDSNYIQHIDNQNVPFNLISDLDGNYVKIWGNYSVYIPNTQEVKVEYSGGTIFTGSWIKANKISNEISGIGNPVTSS